MHKNILILLLAALFLLCAAGASHAALTALGPVSQATGLFPVWYSDGTRTLELCLSKTPSPDPAAAGAPLCNLLPDPGFNPALPIVFPLNFPGENFYFLANATGTPAKDPAFAAAGVTLTYVAALEATFTSGIAINGDQITFSRIRIFADLPTPGTYTITHPYGVETFVVNSVGAGREITFTRDIGVGAPGVSFTGALAGDIGPFLVRSATPGGAPAPISVAPDTFIGDPNVLQSVTGSPFGTNFVHIVGPGIDLTLNQFTLAGKIFGGLLPLPLTVDRATYSRTTVGTPQVEVFATSLPGTTLSLKTSLTAVTPTPMIEDIVTGAAYVQFAPAILPANVIVKTAQAGVPSTSLGAPVVDLVKVTKATYNVAGKVLSIEAVSSDQLTPLPVLTALGWGALTSAGTVTQSLVLANVAEPPATVTVESSAGGTDTEPVIILVPITTLTPTSLTFANQAVNTVSTAQTVTVTNTGAAPLVINSITFGGANPAQFSKTTTCPIAGAGLAIGANCTVSVKFKPTTVGAKTATLAVNVAAPAASKTVALSGTAYVPVDQASVLPASLTFALQAVNTLSAAQTVTVTNTGAASLVINSITFGGTNPAQFISGTLCPIGGAGLASGASCTINVRFRPTTAGTKSATLAVNVAAPALSKSVTLSGTAYVPVDTALLSTPSLTFASQTVGTLSTAQTVTVTNTGATPLIINSIALGGTNPAQFTQTNNCTIGGAGLQPAGSCTISVKFKPTSVGAKSASLNINVAAPAVSKKVALSGTGL